LRRHRTAWGGLLLAAVLCTPALAQRAVTEVRIEGLVRINRAALDGILRTRQGADFSADVARDDLARIVSLGFFDPTACTYDTDNANNGFAVVFHLKENPVITGITVRGVSVPGIDPAAVTALATARYRTGDVFNLSVGSQLAGDVAKLYDDAGFEATIKPPVVGEDGVVIVVVAETLIDDVVINVWPPTDAIDLGKIVEWVGIRLQNPLSEKVLSERRNALMGLGLFSYLAVDLVDGETGVVVRFSAVLNDYPVPSADALPFIDPTKMLKGLAVYRVAPPPYALISEPRPTPKLVATLAAEAQAAPQDGAAAARVAFALSRAGRTQEAVTAAGAALQLLGAATSGDAAALRARLLLLQGDAAGALALLKPLRQDGSLAGDGYPALIEATAALLADSAVTDPTKARAPGDSFAWTIRTLIDAPNPQSVLASDKGTDYTSALAGAWTWASKLDEAGLAANHAAVERLYRLLSLLEYLPPELAPTTIVPDCATDLRKAIDPVYECDRLMQALEKRADDPGARYAWASAIVQRELAITLGPADVAPPEGKAARATQLEKAVGLLTDLIAADPTHYAGAQGLLAIGCVLRADDQRAFDILAGQLDGDDLPDADHLYLLASSISTTRTALRDEEVTASMVILADRLNALIADGKPHPRARYARYSLLAWAEQLDKALEEARAATVAGPTDEPAWAALGFFEAQKGNNDPAEQALVKATELDPTDLHAAYCLGLVRWIKSSDGTASLPLLERLHEESPIDLAAQDVAF
jgi:tetratricopeptide (TPR) repeat protein